VPAPKAQNLMICGVSPGVRFLEVTGDGRLLSALRPEVDHKHVIQHRADDLAEGFVLRMLNVAVAVLLALERENETVREPFVPLLFADVRAPFQGHNLGYLLL